VLQTADLHQGAGLDDASLQVQRRRQDGGPRGGERAEGGLGLAVHQVDQRQVGGDLGARHPVQAVFGLVLQQLGGVVQQVDGDQPLRQAPDHHVPVIAHGRQLTEVVEQGQGLHRLHAVRPAVQEQLAEDVGGLVVQGDGDGRVGQAGARGPHHRERLAVAAVGEIELAEGADDLELGVVAAPAPAQGLVGLDRRRGGDQALGQLDPGGAQFGLGAERAEGGAGDDLVDLQGCARGALGFGQLGLSEAEAEGFLGRRLPAAGDLQLRRGLAEIARRNGALGDGAGEAGALGRREPTQGRGARGELLARMDVVRRSASDLSRATARSRDPPSGGRGEVGFRFVPRAGQHLGRAAQARNSGSLSTDSSEARKRFQRADPRAPGRFRPETGDAMRAPGMRLSMRA
jgi:hypothetical protein